MKHGIQSIVEWLADLPARYLSAEEREIVLACYDRVRCRVSLTPRERELLRAMAAWKRRLVDDGRRRPA